MAARQTERAPTLEAIFSRLWEDYVAITPQALRIQELLRARGERFRNDHVALRSFDRAPIGLDVLAAPFLERGYRPAGEYRFPEKRLFARGYVPPSPELPRLFVSELETGGFSPALRAEVERLCAAAAAAGAGADGLALVTRTPSWPPVSHPVYERLRAESEYAAWVAAFGIRANHFTVHANDLTTFADLAELNRFLEAQGFRLNGSGDKIQGGPEVLLAQSSTIADTVSWRFADGLVREIPSCYYEFARRYRDPQSGELYQGFVAASADRIFESTDSRHHAR